MNKKISVGAAISLIAIACAITFILSSTFSLEIYNKKVQNVKERAEVYKKLDEIDEIVRTNFFGNVDDDKLIEAISEGYVGILGDTNTKYLDADEYRAYKLRNTGLIEGTGLRVEADENGYVIVKNVYENSSAMDMGIQVGDYITKVSGDEVLVKGTESSIKALNGQAGTNVTVTIRSGGVDKDVVLSRSEIEITSVSSREVNGVGVIKITDFNQKTFAQFKNAINDLTEKGVTGYIFDVRNNDSAELKYAIDLLDLVLPEVEVYEKTAKADVVTRVMTGNDSEEIKLPIAVIVNSKTSGASELFAASIRDNLNSSTIVGNTTAGNGSIQEAFDCLDGSGVVLTTSTYKPSKSDSYDDVGIKPNYIVTLDDDSESGLAMLDDNSDLQFKKAFDHVTTATNG